MRMELLFIFIQSAWQRRSIRSLMTRLSKMLHRASSFPSVKCACLLAQVSYTLSLVTCKPCRALAHGQVSSIMYSAHIYLTRTRAGFWEVGLDPQTGRVVGLF